MSSQKNLIGLAIVCVILAIADVTYSKHPHIEMEAWFNFHGFVAVVSTAAIIAMAWLGQRVLDLPEDYYRE